MEIETKNDSSEVIEVSAKSVGTNVDQPRKEKPDFAKFLLPGAILLAALIVSGTLFYVRDGGSRTAQIGGSGTNQPEDKFNVQVGSDDHVLGNKNAKVTIVEFSDFQCPFCRSFWSGALAQIKKNYVETGKARLVYKHFPLDFHPGAEPAAEGAECAGDQGKFWEMHDKIFEEQAKLGQGTVQFTKQDVARWAGAIGLNASQFNQCVSSGKYTKRINDDAAYGAQVGVSGTPTIFINGQRIVGAQPFSTFQVVIDELLQ